MKRLITFLFVIAAALSTTWAQSYDVLFIVDMNQVTDTYTTPEVNGTFNGWCGGCAPMSDDDGDNIWELTIALDTGSYEYKFAADTWTIQEELTVGEPCTITTDIFTNRIIEVSEDMEMDTVCWGSCSSCETTLPSYAVLFQVDMSQYSGAFTTPEVNGTFNGWCGGCAPMSDVDADGIWELEITLDEGSYEYKFAFDTWTGQEEFTEGDPCTVTADGFTNRLLEVESDSTLPAYCFASCAVCETIPESVSDLTNQTFQIWPTPASDILYLAANNGASFNLTADIFDFSGKMISSQMVNNQTQGIDISTFQSGLYLMSLTEGNTRVFTQSFIVQ